MSQKSSCADERAIPAHTPHTLQPPTPLIKMACIASSITNVVALKATKVQVSHAAAAPPLSTFRLPTSHAPAIFFPLETRRRKVGARGAREPRVPSARSWSIVRVIHLRCSASRGAVVALAGLLPNACLVPGLALGFPNCRGLLCFARTTF